MDDKKALDELKKMGETDLLNLFHGYYTLDMANDHLARENARLTQELEKARKAWRQFVDMMEPVEARMDCMCLDPPGHDDERDEDDPSEHSQYCIVYLKAYAEAMANGTKTPA